MFPPPADPDQPGGRHDTGIAVTKCNKMMHPQDREYNKNTSN